MQAEVPESSEPKQKIDASRFFCSSLEEVQQNIKSCKVQNFLQGVFVKLIKPLSYHFQISHNFALPFDLSQGYYSCNTCYVDKFISETQGSPLLQAEISSNGTFSGVFLQNLNENISWKFICSHSNKKWLQALAKVDFKNKTNSLGLTAERLDPVTGTGALNCQLLHQIIPKYFKIGLDLTAWRQMQPEANGGSAHPIVGSKCAIVGHITVPHYKYESLISMSNKAPNLSASIVKSLDIENSQLENVKVFFDAEFAQPMPNSSQMSIIKPQTPPLYACLGYNATVKGSGATFKAMLDTEKKLHSQAEYSLKPLPASVCIGAQLNLATGSMATSIQIVLG
ncbi:MAG: Mitochondrial import receptor subunit TOM40B [Paramarteilia canceri]